jgi:hypothetical protein
MQDRFIACSLLLDPPALDAVRYAGGVNDGLPVLYDSADDAISDEYFNPEWDKVIPASEYFERVKNSNFKF